jgi:hypothetical protein
MSRRNIMGNSQALVGHLPMSGGGVPGGKRHAFLQEIGLK